MERKICVFYLNVPNEVESVRMLACWQKHKFVGHNGGKTTIAFFSYIYLHFHPI